MTFHTPGPTAMPGVASMRLSSYSIVRECGEHFACCNWQRMHDGRAMNDSPYRVFYRDYMLTCRPEPQDDGRFQARVAISAMGGMKTRDQRFIDLGVFNSHDDAVKCAESAGKEWVNNAMRATGIY